MGRMTLLRQAGAPCETCGCTQRHSRHCPHKNARRRRKNLYKPVLAGRVSSNRDATAAAAAAVASGSYSHSGAIQLPHSMPDGGNVGSGHHMTAVSSVSPDSSTASTNMGSATLGVRGPASSPPLAPPPTTVYHTTSTRYPIAGPSTNMMHVGGEGEASLPSSPARSPPEDRGRWTGAGVDFGKLDMDTLSRYARYYGIKARAGATKTILVTAINRHFRKLSLLEEEDKVIAWFLLALRTSPISAPTSPSGSPTTAWGFRAGPDRHVPSEPAMMPPATERTMHRYTATPTHPVRSAQLPPAAGVSHVREDASVPVTPRAPGAVNGRTDVLKAHPMEEDELNHEEGDASSTSSTREEHGSPGSVDAMETEEPPKPRMVYRASPI